MKKRSKLQYVAVVLGWAYTGLLLGMTVIAAFSPGQKIVIHFNRYGELWADLVFFSLAFGLLTWFLFVKLREKRERDE